MNNAAVAYNNRKHIEICFVRNLESLHDDDLRLVIRDKIEPMPNKSGKSSLSQVRIAHSDESLAIMFNIEAEKDMEARFAFEAQNNERTIEVGSDANIYIKGVEGSAVNYFSCHDSGQRWYVMVISLAKAGIANSARGVLLDITLPHTAAEEASTLHLKADLV